MNFGGHEQSRVQVVGLVPWRFALLGLSGCMEALAAALEGDFESDDAMTAVVEQLDRVRSTCTTTEAA